MATKVEQRSYEEALNWLRDHVFDLIEAPGTQGRVFLKKYCCSAAIQKNGDDNVKIFAYPGYLVTIEGDTQHRVERFVVPIRHPRRIGELGPI